VWIFDVKLYFCVGGYFWIFVRRDDCSKWFELFAHEFTYFQDAVCKILIELYLLIGDYVMDQNG
jgi:hypothetical protein